MRKNELAYVLEWAYQAGVSNAHKQNEMAEALKREFRRGQMVEAKRNEDTLRLLDLQAGKE